MAIVITQPWSDKRYGNRTAVLAKEVSGVANEVAARAACGLDKGSEFPDDPTYLCDNWDVTPISIGFYRVTFSFSADEGDKNNPLAQPTRLMWDPNLESVPFDRDLDGNPILNSALDPYDPSPDGDVTDVDFSAARWEPTPFDPQRAVKFMGTVNNADFKIQDHPILEGQCKCLRIAPLGEYTLKAKWVEVGYRFRLRGDGWDSRLLDLGTRSWSNLGRGAVVLTEIYNNGQQINQPVRLNGRGKPIGDNFTDKDGNELVEIGTPKGAEVEEVTGADGKLVAVFLKYKRPKRRNFLELGL